jgi:opacity protein-like surface antigen
LFLAGGLCLSPPLTGTAHATSPVERHGWGAGVAYGIGSADVTLKPSAIDTNTGYTRGASPQFRLGKMVGSHFMVGLEDRQWMNETGLGDEKLRANFQNFNVVLTVYPGKTSNWTSGFFLQGGAGVAHARTSVLEPIPGGNEWGETFEVVGKLDESGKGFMFGAGYEFRVSSHLAAGLTTSFNSLTFDDNVYDTVKFFPGGLNLNWYF